MKKQGQANHESSRTEEDLSEEIDYTIRSISISITVIRIYYR